MWQTSERVAYRTPLPEVILHEPSIRIKPRHVAFVCDLDHARFGLERHLVLRRRIPCAFLRHCRNASCTNGDRRRRACRLDQLEAGYRQTATSDNRRTTTGKRLSVENTLDLSVLFDAYPALAIWIQATDIVVVKHEPPAPGLVPVHEHRLFGGKLFPVFAAEAPKRQDEPIGTLRLAKFAYRRLELVADDGQVVVVGEASALALGHVRASVSRIRPAVVHVEAREIRARPKLDDGERKGIYRLHHKPPVVARRHAAAKLASEIRIPRRTLGVFGFLRTELFGGDDGRSPRRTHQERILVGTRHRLQRTIPEPFRIVAVKRNHLAECRLGAVEPRPSRARIHRNVISRLHGKRLERLVVRPRPAALVLQLHADHRPAVLPEVRGDLGVEPAPEFFRFRHEALVAGAHDRAHALRFAVRPLVRLVYKPVREASFSAFPMIPRSQANDRP